MYQIDPTRKGGKLPSSTRLNKRLALYALTGGVALTFSGTAEAAAYGPCFPGFSATSPGVLGDDPNGCHLDLDGDTVVDFTFEAFLTNTYPADPGPEISGVRVTPEGDNLFAGFEFPEGDENVKFGFPLKPSITIPTFDEIPLKPINETGYLKLNAGGTFPGVWQAVPGLEYLGVGFDIGGDIHFGAVQIDIGFQESATNFTIVGWDYNPETKGEFHIVPEPSSLTLFALGAAGILALRRRRRKKAPNA